VSEVKYLSLHTNMFLNPATVEYSDLQFLGDQPLGEGGSGIVWKGKWGPGDKVVAVKKVMQLIKREVGAVQLCMLQVKLPHIHTLT